MELPPLQTTYASKIHRSRFRYTYKKAIKNIIPENLDPVRQLKHSIPEAAGSEIKETSLNLYMFLTIYGIKQCFFKGIKKKPT